MQKLLKNKLFIGTACLVLAAVLSFVLLPKLNENEQATTSVAVLNRMVDEGTEITEDLLVSVEVGAFGLSDAIVRDKSQVIGMVANSRIYKGEYLTKNRLATAADYKNSAYGTALEPGKFLLALKLPAASSGLAGALRGGGLVDVYTTSEDEVGAITAEKVLSEISVKQLLNSKLLSLGELDKPSDARVDGVEEDQDFVPVYVLVAVDELQARTLIALEKAENFHLTLIKAGD